MGNPSSFLRRVLVTDATVSGLSGIGLIAFSSRFASIVGAPPAVVASAGVSLLPFAAFVWWVSYRDEISRVAVWTAIGLNVAWVAGSILLLFTDLVAPTAIGTAFIVLQAVAVAALAEMQYVGLRRAWA